MFGAGTVGVSTLANFENRLEGMTLPGNGCCVTGSRIGVDTLEKLPVRNAGFGTLANSDLACFVRSPSYAPNANTLFLTRGPPSVNPASFRLPGFCPK